MTKIKRAAGVTLGVTVALAAAYFWFEAQRPPAAVLVPKAIHADIEALALKADSYRQRNGRHASTLADLKAESVMDWGSIETSCRRHYSYAASSDGQAFAIGSVGLDGRPDTADDVLYTNTSDDPKAARSLLGTAHAANACISINK